MMMMVKQLVKGGDQDQADENLLGNKVFGHLLDSKKNHMSLKFLISLSKKKCLSPS